MWCQGQPKAGSVKNSNKMIITIQVRSQNVLKVKNMCLCKIHLFMFALNPFPVRRNIYSFSFIILIQYHAGRCREFKKLAKGI